MIVRTLAFTVFLSHAATFSAACVDEYNEGKAHLNQGVEYNNRAAELYRWVQANDSNLETAQYCEHVNEAKRLYSESTYSFRRASDTLELAVSHCKGDNRNVAKSVRSTAKENLRHTLNDGETMQNLLYKYCS